MSGLVVQSKAHTLPELVATGLQPSVWHAVVKHGLLFEPTSGQPAAIWSSDKVQGKPSPSQTLSQPGAPSTQADVKHWVSWSITPSAAKSNVHTSVLWKAVSQAAVRSATSTHALL
jgi:hypothetical protein